MQSQVYINKANFLDNLKAVKRFAAPKSQLMAVVKSNAYGHGIDLISNLCEESKIVDYLGVVEIQEALHLRQIGIKLPILVLSYTSICRDLLEEAILRDIELSVYDFDTAESISIEAAKVKKDALIHIKIETGLNRLGFDFNEIEDIKKISQLPNIKIKGIFSHFAAVEEANIQYSTKQIERFNDFIVSLKKNEIVDDNCLTHIAASAAGFVLENSRFNLVRSGIAIYGLYPSPEIKKLCLEKEIILKPVLSWETKVLEVKGAKIGDSIGYGCTYLVRKPMKIATLAVGYADGYDRKLSNKGRVLIDGIICPVVGRIAMNMIVVDVSKIQKSVKINNEAVLIGKQGGNEISADDLADLVDTINYEVVTRINWEIKRNLI